LPLLWASACSGDGGDDDSANTTEVTSSTPAVGSDLVMNGEQDCEDEEGDVTTAASANVAPAVPQPGIDLLNVHAELDEETLLIEYSLVGAPVPEADPEFLASIGALDSTSGFELQVQHDSETWVAKLALREEGTNTPVPLPNATIGVDGAVLSISVPVRALPTIGPEMPLLFGTSGLARDGEDYIDSSGKPVDGSSKADRVLDDCIQFGQ
jgi:hypothetical protein